ncbi:MAG: transcriptional repressor [Bacteroidaceae bacterium]|nr:transcriptional repressor [Bacteroidaceae bacterium]
MEETLLRERGIRPTAVRLLVVRILAEADAPLSLAEIEAMLDTAPKSTIFRALTLFQTHRLVHSIEDGSGSLKYELCHSHDHDTLNDRHTHFFCEVCQRTYCFKHIQIPAIELPQGFTMHSVNYIVKGICDKCKAK